MSHEVALLRTKGSSVFTQCVHALVDAREKRHFKFSNPQKKY